VGQRANLILVEHGRQVVYYTHWRANTLPRDLFWGPRYALGFCRAQRLIEDGTLLDEVWAEGGAVLDFDHHALLLFGGEDLRYEMPLQRTYLRLARHVWDGWDVQWAHEGVAQVADYLGRPRAEVLNPQEPLRAAPDLSPPEEKSWVSAVGTVRFEDGRLRAYPIGFDSHEFLYAGPRLLESAAAAGGLERFSFAEWTSGFPNDGFHVDVARRTVGFWTGPDAPGAAARVAAAWPDWTVTWHRDRYEFHLAAAGPALTVPTPGENEVLSRLREMLLVENGKTGPEMLLDTVQRLEAGRFEVSNVNEHALRDARLSLPREERERLVDAAIEAVRGRQ
jgi:hypothetical protein